MSEQIERLGDLRRLINLHGVESDHYAIECILDYLIELEARVARLEAKEASDDAQG